MKRLLLCLILTLSSLRCAAQNGLFFGADRLSSSIITAITQDAYGFLWVGTEHGLDCFDGYSFVPHSTWSPDHPRPTSVASLLTDNEGRLWVGTSRGLYSYDHATNVFTPVIFPDSIEPRVSQMLLLHDGQLVAGTAGYGLYSIDSSTMQATPLRSYAPADDNAYFNHLFLDSQGTFWKSGADNRIVWRDRNGNVGTLRSPCSNAVGFIERDGRVEALCQHGVLSLSTTSQMATPLPVQSPQTSHFTVATTDAQGTVYIGTRGEGLFYIPAGEQTLRRLPTLTRGVDLTRANIVALHIDRDGNLWVGCQEKGLLMIALHDQPLFRTWSFAAQHIPTASSVHAIVAGEEGSDVFAWCAVPGDGLYGFNADGFVVSHLQTPQDTESMLRDTNGEYWIGTADALYRFSPSRGECVLATRLNGDRINTMSDLGNGMLAVSAFGNGLCLIDKSSGRIVRHLTMHDTDTLHRGRLVNDWIYTLDTDAQGCLWIGTSSGVCCYDPVHDTFRAKGWPPLADREACTAVRVLSSGDVLLGLDHGLYRWSDKGGLQPEPGTEPLHERSISFIAEDMHNELWLSTNDGIWHWIPNEQKLMSYMGASGLQTHEFALGAGLMTDDGHIMLGSADGVTLFCPDALRQSSQANVEVHLTALVIGGYPADITTRSNGHRVMDSALLNCHHFRLSYVDSSFQLEFSLLSFADAADITFEYRFEGEEQWQSTHRGHNAIAFNHLAEGDYILKVRARQAGAYTPTATYRIQVLPPWWRSPMAYLIYVLLAVAIAILAIIAYKRHIEHQHDQEKLHLLMNAINAEDTPLTLDDMRRAIHSFVQSRKHKRGIYGDVESMADRLDVPEQRGNDEVLMDRVMQSINRHLGDSEFTVEQLCSEAAISRAHLHRKMKEMTGLSVTEFIRNIRLEQAARLLREQKLNVTQVAYTVGFSSLGYFTTVFRKHFGVSPRDYVKGN